MTPPRRSWTVLGTVLVAGLAACSPTDGDDDADATASTEQASPEATEVTDGTATTDEESAPADAEATGTTVTTTGSEFGEILVDDAGQAIYIWEVETTAEPACYGDCAEAWPPVLTDGAPAAGGSLDAALLGTATRSDGSTQVTYNGHPLYYYAHEEPGEVLCHDVATHGGLWWVVLPDGTRAP